MGDADEQAVVRAYGKAYAETGSIEAAHRAAEAVFRELNPEVTNASIVSSRVAVMVSRAIMTDPRVFWPHRDDQT